MITPSSSTTIGWRKPNSLIDAATASTAASLMRGLFSYGLTSDNFRISMSMNLLCGIGDVMDPVWLLVSTLILMDSSPSLVPRTPRVENDSICRHDRYSLADSNRSFPRRDAVSAVPALAPANEQAA